MEIQRARRGLLASEPVLLLAAVVIALYFARQILIPVALAITLNFLLAPAVIFLHRLRIRRLPAVIIVVLVAGSIVAGMGWVVLRQLILIAEEMPSYRFNIHNKLSDLHPPTTGSVGMAIQGVREVGQELVNQSSISPPNPTPAPQPAPAAPERGSRKKQASAPQIVQPSVPVPVTVIPSETGSFQDIGNFLLPIAKPLGETVVIVVLTIYMLLKREDLRNRLLLLAGMGRLNLVTQAMDDAAQRISKYLVMNFMVNAGYGLLFGVGLFLIGVPNATLWGVIAGLLRFVPYVGTGIGGLLPFAFALGVFSSWGPALVALALFGLLEFSIANFFEPWLYGNRTGISTLALLVMAIFWTLLWGWPGLVLSTPLTVCLIVMGRHVPQMSFLYILLGEDAELTPEAKFYERLLAMDQPEARAIADRFLEDRSILDLYDTVFLPALSLAEQDRHKGALDEARAGFLFQCVNELVAELADFRSGVSDDSDPQLPMTRSFPIVCLSAKDQADEIVATMLAQLLEQGGNRTLVLPSRAISDEILSRLSEEQSTVVCISALPPFAFADARSLCQRLRRQLPKNRIIVGLWGTASDPERTHTRLTACRPDCVSVNLSQCLAQVREWQGQNSYEQLAAGGVRTR